MYTILGDICFRFSWVYAQEWNCWDIWYMYAEHFKKLPKCFPRRRRHPFTVPAAGYAGSSSPPPARPFSRRSFSGWGVSRCDLGSRCPHHSSCGVFFTRMVRLFVRRLWWSVCSSLRFVIGWFVFWFSCKSSLCVLNTGVLWIFFVCLYFLFQLYVSIIDTKV